MNVIQILECSLFLEQNMKRNLLLDFKNKANKRKRNLFYHVVDGISAMSYFY